MGPLCVNMTSFTKPELHKYRNAARGGPSHGHYDRQHSQKLVGLKFDRVVFELCERTDTQTNKHTHPNTSHPSTMRKKVIGDMSP